MRLSVIVGLIALAGPGLAQTTPREVSKPEGAPGSDSESPRRIAVQQCALEPRQELRELCHRRLAQRARGRAVEVLLRQAGPLPTAGPVSECTATAEADCGQTLDPVDTVEYDDGICVWTCLEWTPPPTP